MNDGMNDGMNAGMNDGEFAVMSSAELRLM